MSKRSGKILVVVESSVAALIWLINAYRLGTGLGGMAFLDAACAGMIFFIVPAMAWRAFQSSN